MRKIFAVVIVGGLAGCGLVPQTDNVTACMAALEAAHQPADMLRAAVTTPACVALGEQAVEVLLQRLMVQRGWRR